MTRYDEFIDAYRKAYPLISKKSQYEKAIKIWKDLKSEPESFEENLKKKMSELKVLRVQNNSQNLKTFSQTKLNFGRASVSQVKTVTSTVTESSKLDQNMPSTSRYVEQKMSIY